MYETFEHTADLGIRARAADLNSLFGEAARALFGVILQNPRAVRPVETVDFQIAGKQVDYLLVDWLNELLFAFESRRMIFSEFSVQLDAGGLRAVARGEPFDDARHLLEREVKAITYHGLRVEQTDTGWLAEVILDI
jgi:SHS2 domain-containing protein